MKIGVTGGSGFIGSHVVDKLVQAGHEVRIIDTIPSHRNDVEYVSTNIVRFEELQKGVEDLDVLYHLAAASNVNHYVEKPLYSSQINVMGTLNLLEACRRYDVNRFIFASTVWVYGASNGLETDEQTLISLKGAGHPYTSSKIASELFIQDYAQLYGQKFTILRYGIPYGPRARKGTVIPIFVQRALSGQDIVIFGKGDSGRNFIYIEDLAEGNVCALSQKAENEVYNMDGSEEITLNRIANTILKILNADISIKHKEARPGDYVNRKISIEKAKNDLNWEPKTSFEEGMRLYLEWLKKQDNNS
ncbi:MAG: NAD-dependent epimerase/dehydratase family protein [Candidatus Hodarchaeota archaeon]